MPEPTRNVYGARRSRIEVPDGWPDENGIATVGTCCACRRADVGLRNVVCMTFRAPESAFGKGWGCVVCAIPGNGALAVICDNCMGREAPIVDVCAGYLAEPARAEAEPLRAIPWSHIRAFHPDAGESRDGA